MDEEESEELELDTEMGMRLLVMCLGMMQNFHGVSSVSITWPSIVGDLSVIIFRVFL